jgi:hypothetical protein
MTVGNRSFKRGKASQAMDGKDFCIAGEIRCIQEKSPTAVCASDPVLHNFFG